MKSRQNRAVQVFLVLLFSLVLSCLALGCADESSSDSEVAEISGASDEGETGNDGGIAGNDGDEDFNCITPNSAGEFTLLDINPLSPTYNQERSLSDVCGKVVILYLTAFH